MPLSRLPALFFLLYPLFLNERHGAVTGQWKQCPRTVVAAVLRPQSGRARRRAPAALQELPLPLRTKEDLADRQKLRSTRCGRAAVADSPGESVRKIAAAAAVVLAAACCCQRTRPQLPRLC